MSATIAAAREAADRGVEGADRGAVALGNPFGSNFEGPFGLDARLAMLEVMIEAWHDAGFEVRRCSFVEAMGWNLPHTVRETIEAIRERWPEVEVFHMHLHNQRGQTLASYYEALRLGATEFDTCIGGMGGCPYCGNGRSAGHVPTEDFVDLCHEMGIETGYDLDKLIEAAVIAEEVVGHPLWGHVSKSGPRPRGDRLYPADMPFVETLDEAAHFRLGPDTYAGQISPWREGDALSELMASP
jgi:hydroxymethylglutaryl-CoA lyase